jgi:hypothetical protein
MDGVMNIFAIESKIEQLQKAIKLISHKQKTRNQKSTSSIEGQNVSREKLRTQLENFLNGDLFGKRYIKC